MLTALDARRHVLGSEESEPLPGENLVLTLDANIQFMAEQALERNMERTKAINGTIVVQDPHTGQILALAIRPTFNPNDFRHATKDLLRDHAVSDVYEPGSTFKLVAYSAALEEKVATPDSKIDCQGGAITIAGRTTHDDRDAIAFEHRYNNVISTSQALWESSDVAAIKLALRMGQERYYQYVRAFGFGQRSGIELPSETRGLLKPVKRWEPTSIGSIPMGQEVGVTPIQLITMVSTIANGGMYLPPHILLKSTDLRKGDPKLLPVAFHPERRSAEPAAGWRAPCHLDNDLRGNAQDDGRRGAEWDRRDCAARRLQCRRKNRHRAEDRRSHAYLLQNKICCLICRLRAGKQPGNQCCHCHGFARSGRSSRCTGQRSCIS